MRYKRTDPAIIAYGIYLYFNSRSYRCTSRSLALILKRSHVSIWKLVQRYAIVADRIKISKGLPRAKNSSNDRAPTLEEIRKLTDYPSPYYSQ